MVVMEVQIERLQQRLRQLKLRKVRAEARKRVMDARQERKDDTRRKILIGAVVLAKAKQGVLEDAVLRGWLDSALTRAEDRVLFGFEGEDREDASD